MGTRRMSDDRLFFKLHNGFPEHPKTIELSDKAFRQLVEAWCYCSRNLNDGYLTKSQFLRFFSPKSRGELVAVGFIREEENQYVMHDYLEHQQSAKQVADLRERRRMAGSKGGKAKANGLASAKQMPEQTPSKSLPDTDTDTDLDTTPPKGGEARKRATRIATDFEVTDPMRQWASQKMPGIDLAIETEKFINFWTAKSGKDATKLDWVATWRNWILNARPPQGQRMDHSARGLAKGMAMLQEYDAQQADIFELEA
jgi:hypothetical protein